MYNNPDTTAQDCEAETLDLIGNVFICHSTQREYEFLGTEVVDDSNIRNTLFVLYKDISSAETFSAPWNAFFSCHGAEKGERQPRFKMHSQQSDSDNE